MTCNTECHLYLNVMQIVIFHLGLSSKLVFKHLSLLQDLPE